MKIQVGVTAAVVLAVLVLANVVKSARDETAAQERFAASVRAGDGVYGQRCSTCHERYDPRFFGYEEWARVLDDTGCPAVRVSLEPPDRAAIRDFLRAKAAPTDTEAETVRERERNRFRTDLARRGAEAFGAACGRCHGHPFFAKVRTARGWQEALADLGGIHRGAGEPVWVDEAQARALLAHLSASAAGTPSDANAVKALLEAGVEPVVAPAEVEHGELPWRREYEAAMAEAKEKRLPVILDFTDLSGG